MLFAFLKGLVFRKRTQVLGGGDAVWGVPAHLLQLPRRRGQGLHVRLLRTGRQVLRS